MIVTCEKCHTKFKVPDEKIAEAGTRVRCAVCQSTFEVRRANPAPAEIAGDPFALLVDDPPPPARSAAARGAGNESPLADQLFGDLNDGDLASLGQEVSLEAESPSAVEPDQSLFEMPEPTVEPRVELPRELLPSEEEMLPPAPPRARSLVTAFHEIAPEKWPERKPSRPRKTWSSLLVNLGMGAALILALSAAGTLYVNDGKVDPSSLSPRRWRSLLSPVKELVAVETSNGLYDTRAGKPVFYIRGEAENRSLKSTKLKVRVEILDGEQRVRSAEVMAGSTASPEELYDIASPEDAEALTARLDGAGTEVLPGRRVPFLLTFYDYPPNLAAFRLKIVVNGVSSKETAAR